MHGADQKCIQNFGQVIREGTFGRCRHTYEVNIKKWALKK